VSQTQRNPAAAGNGEAPFLSAIQTLRRRAREHIAQGAVTPVAAEFLEQANDETQHADQIAERDSLEEAPG
jgi:bacterioferritin (cytochrome b1)